MKIATDERKVREGWHRATKEKVHSAVHQALDNIRNAQLARLEQILFAERMYGARPEALHGFSHVTSILDDPTLNEDSSPLPINVIAEVCEGFVAKVAKPRPRIMHVPVGGSRSSKRRARMRTQFTDGVWYQTHLREDARQVAFHAAISGTGFLKAFSEHNQICHEVVPPEEIWVDDADARRGKPRSLYQRRYVDRDVLIELYPEWGSEIDGAGKASNDDHWPGYSVESDQVLVTEAWHLRSGPEAKDGRHVLCVDTATLVDEEWTWDRFPFAVLRFAPPRRGFYDVGLAEELTGLQVNINDLAEQISDNVRKHANVRVYLERGSRVNPNDFSDSTGDDFIEYTGRPPIVVAPSTVPTEVYNLLWEYVRRAFMRAGLSEMSAQSVKPAGLDSGKALRVYSDIETTRHILAGYAWEEWHVDVAELDLLVARQIAEQDRSFAVLHVGRRYGKFGAQKIKFWEVESKGEEFVIRPYPTSMLPDTPAGRLAMVAELEDREYITREQAMEQLESPETDRLLDESTAGLQIVEWCLEQMLDEGHPIDPEGFYPLELCLEKGNKGYLLAVQDGVPEERLMLVRDFLTKTKGMLDERAAAEAPMPPMPTPMPPGGAIPGDPTMDPTMPAPPPELPAPGVAA